MSHRFFTPSSVNGSFRNQGSNEATWIVEMIITVYVNPQQISTINITGYDQLSTIKYQYMIITSYHLIIENPTNIKHQFFHRHRMIGGTQPIGMGNIWKNYGKYMGNVWEIYGKSMAMTQEPNDQRCLSYLMPMFYGKSPENMTLYGTKLPPIRILYIYIHIYHIYIYIYIIYIIPQGTLFSFHAGWNSHMACRSHS